MRNFSATIRVWIPVLSIFSVLSCDQQVDTRQEDPVDEKMGWTITSEEQWVVNQGLHNVESIIYDRANRVFYASNGVDYAVGTSGFISSISRSGDLVDLKWVSGLNRPTGMAIHDSLLYVADVNVLLVINTLDGSIVDRHLEPVPKAGLNDVAINAAGDVFVSASFVHGVCRLEKKQLILMAEDEEKLKWCNGLWCQGNQLWAAGLHFSVIDLATQDISRLEVNEPIADFDGIASDGLGGYFLTTVENSSLCHVNVQMQATTLLKGDYYFGDLAFLPGENQLIVPRGNKKKDAFYISVFTVENKVLQQ